MSADRIAEMAQTRALSPDATPPSPPTHRVACPEEETQQAGAAPLPLPAGEGEVPTLPGEALDARLGRAGHQRPAAAGGRYELRGIEGMGATSRVYRVFDRDLAREIAVKVLTRSGPDDDAEVASFIDEARITAELQHPNVLPVYEIDAGARGELYFSMKRIEGRSLGQALEAVELGERIEHLTDANSIVSVFIAVCQALSYAHHHGVIHQDIKPDNIMLGDFGEVLLVDWGAAARISDAKPKLYGTPLYMSPEQARLDGVSPRSDVYCLGATLFHALLGRPPTLADDLDALMEKKKRGEIDAPTHDELRRAPIALVNVALKAMSADPDARYASIEAMLKDLKDFQAGLAVSAYRDPLWVVLKRWYQRNRKAVWVGAVAMLALAGAGAALWREKAKERSDWTPLAEIDFAHETPASLARQWTALLKNEVKLGEPFEPVAVDDGRFFSLADGKLVMLGDHDLLDLTWKGVLPGDFRVEWDYCGRINNLNLNCFIGPDRVSGFSFHLGGYGDPRWAMMGRGNIFVDQRRLDQPIEIGRTYRYTMEKQDRHIRLLIDGSVIFDYADYDALGGVDASTFGFDIYPRNHNEISHLRILTRPLPQRISPLTVARKLYQAGKVPEATREYAEIIAAYPGTELAASAAVERAICEVRSGDERAGVRDLLAFAAAHPDHEMMPLALYERLRLARAAGDAALTASLRHELARWRGHPVLHTVLAEIAEEQRPLLVPRTVTELGGSTYEPDIVARVLAAQAEIKRWADAYGLPADDSTFTKDAGALLLRFGRFDEVMAIFDPRDRFCGQVLRMTGRYEEHDRRFRGDPASYMASLLDQARYREIVELSPWDENKALALLELGEFGELERRFPRSAALDSFLLSERRFDEFLARHPPSESPKAHVWPFQTPAYRLLVAQGDWRRILEDYDNPTCRAEALRALGEHDQASLLLPGDPNSATSSAMMLLRLGEREHALRLLAPFRGFPLDHIEASRMYSNLVIPALLPVFLDGAGAEAALTPLLAAHRWDFNQRLRYLLPFILGRIDEAEFRRQPYQRGIEEFTLLAKGLRADCRGDKAEAATGYQGMLGLPWCQHQLWGTVMEFVRWRLQECGGTVPVPVPALGK